MDEEKEGGGLFDFLGDTIKTGVNTYGTAYLNNEIQENFSQPAPVRSPEPYSTREVDTSLTETPSTDTEKLLMIGSGVVVVVLLIVLISGRK